MNKRLIASVLALGFVLIELSGAAVAASAPAGQGLEISPPLVTTDTDPGKTVTFDIKVRNVTKDTVIASAEIDDFSAYGELGQSKVVIGTSKEPSPYSIRPWIEKIDGIELGPGEQKPVKVTLDVPTTASPGAHYGVVRFSSAAPGVNGTGVALNASVGTLVLMNVSGKVNIKANIASFYTADSKGKAKSFFNNGPVDFVVRLQNQGNTFFRPLGTVRVTSTFGGQVGVVTVNKNGGNVLPVSIRRFEQQLDKKHMFGRYKAELNMTYNGKALNQTISFWVIPVKQVAAVVGALLILIVLIRVNTKRAVKKATKKASGTSSTSSSKKKKK